MTAVEMGIKEALRLLRDQYGIEPVEGSSVNLNALSRWYHARVVDARTGERRGQRWFRWRDDETLVVMDVEPMASARPAAAQETDVECTPEMVNETEALIHRLHRERERRLGRACAHPKGEGGHCDAAMPCTEHAPAPVPTPPACARCAQPAAGPPLMPDRPDKAIELAFCSPECRDVYFGEMTEPAEAPGPNGCTCDYCKIARKHGAPQGNVIETNLPADAAPVRAPSGGEVKCDTCNDVITVQGATCGNCTAGKPAPPRGRDKDIRAQTARETVAAVVKMLRKRERLHDGNATALYRSGGNAELEAIAKSEECRALADDLEKHGVRLG